MFAIGDTVVGCRATDAAGNASARAFTVHVRGPEEQLRRIVDREIDALGLPPVLTAQVKAQLTAAVAAIVRRPGEGVPRAHRRDRAAAPVQRTERDKAGRRPHPRLRRAGLLTVIAVPPARRLRHSGSAERDEYSIASISRPSESSAVRVN